MNRVLTGKVILLLVFITTFWFSSKPANISSEQSKGTLVRLKIITTEDILHRTPKYLFWSSGIRKLAHFGLYAIAGIGAFMATGDMKKSILIVFFMGSFDEIHQYFIPGRGAQLKDVLLDTLGGTTGAVFTSFILGVREQGYRVKTRLG